MEIIAATSNNGSASSDSVDTAPKNVDECPPPPNFMKLFNVDSFPLQPPPLPNESLYNKIYNGVLPKIREKNKVYDSSRDYRSDLKRYF